MLSAFLISLDVEQRIMSNGVIGFHKVEQYHDLE
jgi:hypothetical protein